MDLSREFVQLEKYVTPPSSHGTCLPVLLPALTIAALLQGFEARRLLRKQLI